MNEKDLIKWHNKQVDKRNKLVDEHNKYTRYAFGIAFVFLFIFLSLCSCDSLSDDCDEYNQTVERYDELIQWARDNGDGIQVHLLIDERNRKLSNLDC